MVVASEVRVNRAAARRVIERALRTWRPITDTDRWEIKLQWSDTPENADGRTAGIAVLPQYEAATATFNLDLIARSDHTARTLEYEVLHELCHCHLAQLSRLADQRAVGDRVADANELATKKFAAAIWRARYGEEPPA